MPRERLAHVLWRALDEPDAFGSQRVGQRGRRRLVGVWEHRGGGRDPPGDDLGTRAAKRIRRPQAGNPRKVRIKRREDQRPRSVVRRRGGKEGVERARGAQLLRRRLQSFCVRGCARVFEQSLVPLAPRRAAARHVAAEPDVPPVGRQLEVGVDVDGQPGSHRQGKEAEGSAVAVTDERLAVVGVRHPRGDADPRDQTPAHAGVGQRQRPGLTPRE